MSTEKPTRTYTDDAHDDYREDHPAYAVIGASRVSTGPSGHRLFGSDFTHQNYVTITVKAASLSRGLSRDWIHGSGPALIEVALSEAQWATFVSSMNVGDGVPATLQARRTGGYEQVPGIEDAIDRRAQLNSEVADTFRETIEELQALRDSLPTKKAQASLDHVITQLRSNFPFVANQFDRHAEKTVEKAKVEVNAYVTQMLQRTGLAALTGGEPAAPFRLGSEDE